MSALVEKWSHGGRTLHVFETPDTCDTVTDALGGTQHSAMVLLEVFDA